MTKKLKKGIETTTLVHLTVLEIEAAPMPLHCHHLERDWRTFATAVPRPFVSPRPPDCHWPIAKRMVPVVGPSPMFSFASSLLLLLLSGCSDEVACVEAAE